MRQMRASIAGATKTNYIVAYSRQRGKDFMTKKEFFYESMPQIVKMAVECQKMSAIEYDKWKTEVLAATSDPAKDFLSSVLVVIEAYLKNNA